MIFLERDVTSDEIDSLGKNLLSTVNTIADPEDPDLRKMANLAVMSAAVSNEVRYFERLIKPGPRQSTEGLGDIFIYQVNSIPLTEGQTIGNYMSTMKARCHSNPDSTVFRVRDESDHLIFTEFHQPAKNIPKN